MKYMGSKNKIANEILPIILSCRKKNQWYVEPFVGGANMIDKVTGNRIASDSNEYLIELLKKMQDGYIPPDFISEELYNDVKNNKENFEKHFVGYIGTQMTFGSLWFGTFRRDITGKRNYSIEAKKNIINQQKQLKGIKFFCCSYDSLEIPENSIIYCDPPYANTAGYIDEFNSDKFWAWCREKVKQGHSVFVSEYNAPKDFICIWSKKVNSSIHTDTGSKKEIEKLFIHESQKHLKPISLFD